MATEEELRAEQYQRDVAAREAFQAGLDGQLHGLPSVRHELEKAWDPLYQWLRERGAPPVSDDEDC